MVSWHHWCIHTSWVLYCSCRVICIRLHMYMLDPHADHVFAAHVMHACISGSSTPVHCTLVVVHVYPTSDFRKTCIPVLAGRLAYTLIVAPVHTYTRSLLVGVTCAGNRTCSVYSFIRPCSVLHLHVLLSPTWYSLLLADMLNADVYVCCHRCSACLFHA